MFVPTPLTGNSLVDIDLCREGLRLARLLHELLPDEAMPAAVLALILLTEARRPARIDAEGDVVLLSVQDRTRWDQAMIAEGRQLLATSLRRTEGIADPYQLQAAVAAEHDRAADYPNTDWAEVIRLYFGLDREHSLTLEEIGERFQLTRERVRQIKEKAIRRLRHTSRSKALRAYLG